MGRGLEALLGQMSKRPAPAPARRRGTTPPPRRRPRSCPATNSPISRSICCSGASTSRAWTCARNRSKNSPPRSSPRASSSRSSCAPSRAPRRGIAALRDHRRRTPLARRADRGPRHRARGHPPGARRSGHRDGAHREHPAREPESARRSARARTADQRIRHHAPAGGRCGRPLARGGFEPAAPARTRARNHRLRRKSRARDGSRARLARPHAAAPADRSRRAGREERPVGARDRGAGAQHAGQSRGRQRAAQGSARRSIPTSSGCRTSCRKSSARRCRSSTPVRARAKSSSATTRSMSSTASSRTFTRRAGSRSRAGPARGCARAAPESGTRCLHSRDDFDAGLANWQIEAEKPGRIDAANGVLDIDVPAGVTLWFKPQARRPGRDRIRSHRGAAGGPNDQVSDLNVFWMANNRDGTAAGVRDARAAAAFARVQRPAHVLRGARRQPQHHHALPPLHRRPGAAAAASRARSVGARGTCWRPTASRRSRSIANGRTSNSGATATAASASRPGAVHQRLVRAAHDVQPPAHLAPADLPPAE